VLENVRLSGFERLVIATQYRARTLEAPLNHWASRFAGGLERRDGRTLGGPEGYRGTADAVRANIGLIDALGVRHLLILAADHVYEMGYGGLIAAHIESGARATVAALAVPRAEGRGFGVFATNGAGRVTDFAEKPQDPRPIPDQPDKCLASMGLYVMDWAWLRALLLANPAAMDFGHDVLPAAQRAGGLHLYSASDRDAPDGRLHWRDVGTLDAYREAALDHHARLMRALSAGRAPHRPAPCTNVLLPGAWVSTGAALRNCIVAGDAAIPPWLRVGWDRSRDARLFRVADGGTVLITKQMLTEHRRELNALSGRR